MTQFISRPDETLYALSDALGVTCDHWRQFLTTHVADEPVKAKKAKGKKK
ncbi:hypothetical protein BH11PLA2_BH11PLA2_29160 [soil metagenome]